MTVDLNLSPLRDESIVLVTVSPHTLHQLWIWLLKTVSVCSEDTWFFEIGCLHYIFVITFVVGLVIGTEDIFYYFNSGKKYNECHHECHIYTHEGTLQIFSTGNIYETK